MNYYCILSVVQNFLLVVLCNKFISVLVNGDDIFRQDIGDKMEIGVSDKGYKAVELRCGSESMIVNLETEDEFLGVIYTRGSFYDKRSVCMYDTEDRKGETVFKLQIPFDKCNTVQEGNVYSNVLVLQHDKELIMPGDAAFSLECNFNQPRDITVTANLHSTDTVVSRIALIDADPSKRVRNDDKRGVFESYTNSVIITPEALRRRKEEL